MSDRILVLGGAGYIGSVLTPLLVDKGFDVTVIDNFLYGQASINQLAGRKNFKVVRLDVRNHLALMSYVAKADVILPLAALVGAPLCDLNPVDAELVNLRHPLALFQSMSEDQLCIMPTTESAYGANVEICTEETPVNPLSSYARIKVEVEKGLMARKNSIALRPATVFGMSPRMRLDLLVNDFAWRAYKDHSMMLFQASFKRTVIHVSDICSALLHVIENADAMLGQVYNVGGFTVSKLDLCAGIKAKMAELGLGDFYYHVAPLGADPDQRNYVVSSDKIKATGWKPQVGLEDGLEELFKGFAPLKNSRYGNI